MNIYEEVVVPAVPAKPEETITKKVAIACDLCGDRTRRDWSGFHETMETEVRIKEGKNYPEAGWGTETEWDICPTPN